jgi:hypothetical protein
VTVLFKAYRKVETAWVLAGEFAALEKALEFYKTLPAPKRLLEKERTIRDDTGFRAKTKFGKETKSFRERN